MATDPKPKGTGSPRKPFAGIASIEALGVLGEFNYSLDFGLPGSEKSIRVIYAENGMGKTTFLRAVYHLLSADVENLLALSDVAIDFLRVTLRSGTTVEFSRFDPTLGGFQLSLSGEIFLEDALITEGQMHLSLDEGDLRTIRRVGNRPDIARYLEHLGRAVAPTVLVGDDRLIYSGLEAAQSSVRYRDEREQLRHRHKPQSSSVKETLDQVERALIRMALVGISNDQSLPNSGVYLEITRSILSGTEDKFLASEARRALLQKSRQLLDISANFEKYGLISLAQVRSILTEIDKNRSNSARFKSLHSVIDPYLSNLLDEVSSLAPAQKRIDTFVTSVNRFLERKDLLFDTLTGVTLVNRHGEGLDPDSLSSGEKHLLLLLSNAILATFTGSLVIIDEPELSLGLKWQRILLAELSRCTEGTGVQFLIASHSVQIMADVEELISPTEVPT